MSQNSEDYQTRSGLVYSSGSKLPSELEKDKQTAIFREKAQNMTKEELVKELSHEGGLDVRSLIRQRKEELVEEYV